MVHLYICDTLPLDNSRLTHTPSTAVHNTTKPDSDSNKKQTSDSDISMTVGEDDESIVWKNLLEIIESSDEGDVSFTDDEECPMTYKQEHTVLNI